MRVKQLLKRAALAAGFDVRRVSVYQPLYSPWCSPEFLAEYGLVAPYTLVSDARCYVLASLAAQASGLDGEVWECGVYRGGTAMLLARRLGAARPFRLFDTFAGMPETDPARDLHKAGDFSDTSLEGVRSRITADFVHFHQGLIPDTFRGLESARIAFAHVDVDIYTTVRACCEFIFPRLCVGGFMVFDDYGFPSCPGARAAVDEFFYRETTVPLVLQTGQAVVFRSTT
jgi:O-methyltransferase